jgi:hypothetical protein
MFVMIRHPRRMGIGSESAGALKGSVLYQSPAVLVNVSVAERTPVSLVQMARSIQPSWCPIAFTNNLHAWGLGKSGKPGERLARQSPAVLVKQRQMAIAIRVVSDWGFSVANN